MPNTRVRLAWSVRGATAGDDSFSPHQPSLPLTRHSILIPFASNEFKRFGRASAFVKVDLFEYFLSQRCPGTLVFSCPDPAGQKNSES